MNKFVYALIICISAALLFICTSTLSSQYQEEMKRHNYAISSCEETLEYTSDALIIINYIKTDCSDREEVVRKCDRITEYLTRSKDSTTRVKDIMLMR